MSQNAQTALDDTLNALDTNSGFQQEIVANMLNNIVSNYASAYGTINDIIAGSGTVLSYTLESALETTSRDATNATRVVDRAMQSTDFNDGIGTGGYVTASLNDPTPNSYKANLSSTDLYRDMSNGNLNKAKSTVNSYVSDTASSNLTNNQGAGGTQVNRITYPATASPTSISMKVGESKTVTITHGLVSGVYDCQFVSAKVASNKKSVTFTGAKAGSEAVSIATNPDGVNGSGGPVVISISVAALPVAKKTTTTKKTTTPSVSYYPATSPVNGSISETLMKAGGYSWDQVKKYTGIRSQIAKANGISNYTGTAAQNTQLLNLLKSGKLIKPRKKGGIIDQIIPIKGMLGGDDGLASVQLGEAVLSRPFMQDVVPEFMNTVKQTTALLQPLGGNGGEVNVHYDSLLTVNGNVDKEALPGLRDLLQQSYEYTSQKMYKDLSKLGFR